MEIDAGSVMVVVVALAGAVVLIALILSVVLARGRWRKRGFGWLVMGNMAFLVPVVGIMMRQSIGFEAAATAAIAGALFGIVFAYFAVLESDGIRIRVLPFCLIAAGASIGQGLLAAGSADVTLLILTSSLINSVLTAGIGAHVWRVVRRYGPRVATLLCLPFAIIAAAYALRLGLVLAVPNSPAPVLATVLIVIVMALAVIILQIGFLMLAESRARNVTASLLKSARDAAQSQERFLKAISHEIRTPLNGILGLSELLRSGAAGPLPETGQVFATEIHSSGQKLLNMFDALLDISLIGKGSEISLHEEPILVSVLLSDIAAGFVRQATLRGVRIVSHPDPPDCALAVLRVQGDRGRLTRLLSNLMDNAIKYAAKDGQVVLSCRKTPQGDIEIGIQDDGAGIAAADMPLALSLFGRIGGVDNPANGAGVGLTLAAEIARAHQGRLDLVPAPEGGLLSRVTLPRDRVLPDAPLPPMAIPRDHKVYGPLFTNLRARALG